MSSSGTSVGIWENALAEAKSALNEFAADREALLRCDQFAQILSEVVLQEGRIFSCGNGGSHCDAMHFSEELTGRFRGDRNPIGALALGDPSHLTCVSNDFGFEHVYSRQVSGLGRRGDVLLAISTSGNSVNLIRAVEAAQSRGMRTVALLGKGGGKLKDLVELPIVVPGKTSDRIQEIHIKILHTAVERLEDLLKAKNWK